MFPMETIISTTYIKQNNIAQNKRSILKKYVETDCKLLCAIVTDAKGFVRQSVGDDVSEERVNVITAAYSLVGEVGYFWGGKSTTIGEGPELGNMLRRFLPAGSAKHRYSQSIWAGLQRICYLGCDQWISDIRECRIVLVTEPQISGRRPM